MTLVKQPLLLSSALALGAAGIVACGNAKYDTGGPSLSNCGAQQWEVLEDPAHDVARIAGRKRSGDPSYGSSVDLRSVSITVEDGVLCVKAKSAGGMKSDGFNMDIYFANRSDSTRTNAKALTISGPRVDWYAIPGAEAVSRNQPLEYVYLRTDREIEVAVRTDRGFPQGIDDQGIDWRRMLWHASVWVPPDHAPAREAIDVDCPPDAGWAAYPGGQQVKLPYPLGLRKCQRWLSPPPLADSLARRK